MILYPAIDLKGGQCVRLKLGDMAQATRWYLAAADRFRDLGDREGMASARAMLSFCGLQYLNAPFGAAGLDVNVRLYCFVYWGAARLGNETAATITAIKRQSTLRRLFIFPPSKR